MIAADSGEPIRKARVDLIAQLGDRRDPVYADADGRFQFAGVPSGRYTLAAWKSGYAISAYGTRSFWEPPAVITLEPGQSADGVAIALPKGAAISGRVLDDAGEPLPDMQVSVGRVAPVDGRARFQAFGQPRSTDDRGEYRIGGLPPGQYVISVFGRAAPSVSTVGGDNFARPRATFYPQTPFITQARPVMLRAGDEVGSIDVTFTPDALITPTVSGRIIDPQGDVRRASVLVTSAGDGVAAAVRGQMLGVSENGEFSLRLVPGEYTLTAQTDERIARTRLTIDRSDISNVELVLGPGARIAGRVVFEGASRRPDSLEVVAVPVNAAEAADFSRMNYQPARVRADGSFRVTKVIGSVELRVGPETRGWRTRSILVGGRNVVDTPMAFAGGEELREVVIVMTDRHGGLTGVVHADSQAFLPSTLSVILFPTDARQVHRSRWLRPDQQGVFAVDDLAPGDYLVAAAADVDDLQWQTAAYLDRLRLHATRVVLGDGETKSIALEWAGSR